MKSTATQSARRTLPVTANRDAKAGVAFWLGFPCLLYGLMSLSLRSLGELPLLIATTSALVAITYARQWPLRSNYLPFFAYSTVVFGFSLLHMMPTAWTTHHDNIAALRQWFYVPALPILVTYFAVAIRYAYPFLQRNALSMLALTIVLSRLSQMSNGPFDPETDIFFYTLTNDVAIVAMTFAIFLFRAERPWALDLAIILAAFAVSSSSQSQLFCLGLAGIRMTRHPALAVTTIAVACLSFIAIAAFYAVPLHDLDHNTGVRAILWRDTVRALVESHGIGVGYGTEYIRHHFEDIMPLGWTIGTGPDDIFVATHSSFYDVMLREGVIGLSLFAYWFFTSLPMPATGSLHRRRLLAAIATLLVVNSSVNVGLSSITYLFGSAFAVALVMVLADALDREKDNNVQQSKFS